MVPRVVDERSNVNRDATANPKTILELNKEREYHHGYVFCKEKEDSMPFSKDQRHPIQGFPPISEAEAEELAQRAQEAVRARYEGALEPREGEKGDTIGALLVMTEFVEYRTAAMARQTVHAAEAFFHEQEVITPAEEAFAAK